MDSQWPLSWTGVKPQKSAAQMSGTGGEQGKAESAQATYNRLGCCDLPGFLLGSPCSNGSSCPLDIPFPCPFCLGSTLGDCPFCMSVNGSEDTFGLFYQVISIRTFTRIPSTGEQRGRGTSLWTRVTGPESFLSHFPLAHVPLPLPLGSQKLP